MLHGFEFDPGLNDRWRAAVDAFKADAAAAWPRESVGLVGPDGGYVATPNVSAEPLSTFELSEGVFEEVQPIAVLHSHCSTLDGDGREAYPPNAPSAADMRSQMDTAVPWGIALVGQSGATDPFWFGDQVRRPPLLGRTFRHGVDDCYSLIRDWHAEVAGIKLPDFPRDEDWWYADQDLYSQFGAAGFARVIRGDQPRPGDVFLCSVRSKVLNHGGVYVGDGLILHHLFGQLSLRAPAAVWRSKLDFLVRHNDLPEDWEPPK